MTSTASRPLIIAVSIIALAIGVSMFASQAAAVPEEPEVYAEYRNDRWGFSLAVPANMTVGEYEREGEGQSIQFTDLTGDKILTISAWPYTQLDVALGREGAPSSTWDQPDHLEIVDVARNDLFTVLFQKNGVRYVVVTMPELEPWLTEILTTWQFID